MLHLADKGLFIPNPIESEFILVTPKDLEGTGVMHGEALSLFGKSFELAQKPEVLSLLSQMEKLEALEGEEYVEFKRILGDSLFKEVECQLGDQESATLEALIESRKGENNMPSLADAIKEIAEKVGKKKGIILGRQEGRQEWMIEGRRNGKREALLEVAQKMIDDSMDMSLISRYTGLSSEVVGQLARHQVRLT